MLSSCVFLSITLVSGLFLYFIFFFLMIRRPPRSTLFPYHDALPISRRGGSSMLFDGRYDRRSRIRASAEGSSAAAKDRKSTRLNSSHLVISYAVFCLKKKK